MIILPAIDILDGKPVRLYQGDYDKSSQVYSSVFDAAKMFERAGATYLHMVDLNGAKAANRVNQDLICEVAKNTDLKIEVGGGIRSMESVAYYLDHGVERVILGTAALEDEVFLKDAISQYGSRIVVGIDCKDGFVCGSGWLNKSDLYYLDFAKKMESFGVSTLICTDISKDGTLNGPNLEMLKNLKNHVSCNIIASGGIRDLDHIKDCKNLGLYGTIVGKAVYSHTLDLESALELCKEG